MTDLEIFSEMIRPSARVDLVSSGHDKAKVVLKEQDCLDSKVTITGMPGDSLVIRADKWPAPDQVFAGSKHECRRADYAIVAQENGKTVIVYIEMKKSRARSREIIPQLSGAMCFVDYCQSIGKVFWKKRNFLSGAEHHFVAFCHTCKLDKRRSRIQKTKSFDSPGKFQRISNTSRVHFNKLIGRL